MNPVAWTRSFSLSPEINHTRMTRPGTDNLLPDLNNRKDFVWIKEFAVELGHSILGSISNEARASGGQG